MMKSIIAKINDKLKYHYYKKILKLIRWNVWANTYKALTKQVIVAYWWRGQNNKNWGDKINPWIIQCLSKRNVIHVDDVINFSFIDVYTCVGSIIHLLRYKGIHIWGVGMIAEYRTVKIKPKKIHAVRGPSTRKRLLEEGYDCAEIYGDPALLIPKFYTPIVAKKYNLGIIAHYLDKESEKIPKLNEEDCIVIDIFGGETDFIDRIYECKNIVSSSLHGLIVADAYGIPSKWIKFSNKIRGSNFKYGDYYQSIGLVNEKPIVVSRDTTTDELIRACWKKEIDIDLDLLLEYCPYYENGNKIKKSYLK